MSYRALVLLKDGTKVGAHQTAWKLNMGDLPEKAEEVVHDALYASKGSPEAFAALLDEKTGHARFTDEAERIEWKKAYADQAWLVYYNDEDGRLVSVVATDATEETFFWRKVRFDL